MRSLRRIFGKGDSSSQNFPSTNHLLRPSRSLSPGRHPICEMAFQASSQHRRKVMITSKIHCNSTLQTIFRSCVTSFWSKTRVCEPNINSSLPPLCCSGVETMVTNFKLSQRRLLSGRNCRNLVGLRKKDINATPFQCLESRNGGNVTALWEV